MFNSKCQISMAAGRRYCALSSEIKMPRASLVWCAVRPSTTVVQSVDPLCRRAEPSRPTASASVVYSSAGRRWLSPQQCRQPHPPPPPAYQRPAISTILPRTALARHRFIYTLLSISPHSIPDLFMTTHFCSVGQVVKQKRVLQRPWSVGLQPIRRSAVVNSWQRTPALHWAMSLLWGLLYSAAWCYPCHDVCVCVCVFWWLSSSSLAVNFDRPPVFLLSQSLHCMRETASTCGLTHARPRLIFLSPERLSPVIHRTL